MKELYIDLHSEPCLARKDTRSDFGHECDIYPERFLFFLGNDFQLITYHSCMCGHEYDFKKYLLETTLKKHKVLERWKVNKGVHIDKDLRDFRIRNKDLKKYIQQVNYIYRNAAGKKFAITTLTPYVDAIFNQDIIDANYKASDEFLKGKGYDWLREELYELHCANYIGICDDVEVFKTVEHLISRINQLTK